MSDADFVEAVLRSLEKLDATCLRFVDADTTKPRDLQVVQQRFRDVQVCIAELLNCDLLRLDALAMEILQSSPGDWANRLRNEIIGGQAADVDELHRRARRRHPSLLNLTKLLRGKGGGGDPVGNDQGEGEESRSGRRKKLRQPSDDAFKCYRLLLALGGKQAVIAQTLAKELGRPVDQPRVSRWGKQVKEWIEAGNVLPDLTAKNGPKPKIVFTGPARIDRGDGMKTATRPRRSDDDD